MKTNQRDSVGRYHKLLALFLILSPAFLFSCEFCTFNRNFMPLESQNSFGLSHRYKAFNGYESLDQQTKLFPSGAYRLPSPPPTTQDGGHYDAANSMAPSDFESFKVIEMRARYFVHPKIEMNIFIPFVNNKQEWLGMESKIFGPGDISLLAGYHLIEKLDGEKFKHRLIVGLGAKIPTGKSDYTYSDGDRLPIFLQGGTGSFDGLGMISWSCSYQDWVWGISLANKYNGSNKYDEKILPTTVTTAFITRVHEKGNWTFMPQMLFHQEYSQGLQQGEYLVPGTFTNLILAGAGLEAYYKKMGFSLSLQLPLYQEVYYMDMKIAGKLSAGISYNFGTEKYLCGSKKEESK